MLIEDVPKTHNLKVSIIEVTGFNAESNLYFSGTNDNGYTVGVAYIHNWMKKDKAKVRSLYFAVKDEINIPNPKLRKPEWSNISGIKKILRVKSIFDPL